GSQVQAWRAVVADVEEWLIDGSRRVRAVGIRRVVLRVAVRCARARRAGGVLKQRRGQTRFGQIAVDRLLDAGKRKDARRGVVEHIGVRARSACPTVAVIEVWVGAGRTRLGRRYEPGGRPSTLTRPDPSCSD